MNNPKKNKAKLIKDLKTLQQQHDSLKAAVEKDSIQKIHSEDTRWGDAENYRKLIELMPDGVYKSTGEGKFVYANPSMVKMLGYENKEELMSIDIKKQLYFDPSERESVILNEKNKELGVYRMRKKDGSEIWVEDHGWLSFDKTTNTLFHEGILRDVTERIQSEKNLHEINRRFSDLVESTNGIVWEADAATLIFNYVSKNAERMLGYPVENWLKEGFWASKIHPEDRRQTIQFCEDQTNQNRDHEFEYRFIRQDGSFVWLRDYVKVLLENGKPKWLRGLMVDVTQSKLAEENLRKLSQAVEQSPVSITITDTNGSIQYVNKKLIETSGYGHEEMIGQNPRILKAGNNSPEQLKQLWKTISSGQSWHGEFHNKRKNGDLYWESSHISPVVDAKGITTHYIFMNEDITDRKKLDILLQQKVYQIEVQNEELTKAKERAEESDRLKSAFLANMSHEIRTPMNGILGFAGLLKESNLSGEEQQNYIDIIEKSGIRMLNIINDIVDISKIEAGLMQLSIGETNINDEIDHIYTFFKPQVEKKQMQLLSRKGLSATESIIKSDSEKIYSILTNLVKNALKYTENGIIEFGYLKKKDFLEFYVKDTGIGISTNQLETVFDRFIQVGTSDKRAIQGAGLGLSISKAYVEMLGGKIWIESQEGKGSTFYFTIPYTKETKGEIKSKTFESNNTPSIKKLKILIVEDDDVSKLLITKMIDFYSHTILKAGTGSEAVKICLENPDLDLVLMDVNMPEMNGYDATKFIREINQEVIVIAQTAYGFSSDAQMAIDAGCNDYISKPIMKKELIALIEKYFKK